MSHGEKFSIEVTEDHRLESGSTVAHKEHGPMIVDQVRVGPHHKTALLESELGPEALKLSGEELRQMWGETIHIDPMEIQEPTVSFGGISVEGQEIEVELCVSGNTDFESIERVAIHARDQVVRAMEAERDHSRPEYCEGTGVTVDWDALIESVQDGDAR